MNTIMVKILLEDLHPEATFTEEYVKTILEAVFLTELAKPYPRVKLVLMEVNGDKS